MTDCSCLCTELERTRTHSAARDCPRRLFRTVPYYVEMLYSYLTRPYKTLDMLVARTTLNDQCL